MSISLLLSSPYFSLSSFNSTLIKARNYQVPIRFLVDVFISNRTTNIVPYLAISTGVLILGLTIAIFAFNYVRNIAINVGFKEKDHKYKQVSVKKALFKKEVEILTKNADYTVSYIGLLIVQPFLAYLVISALNTIFNTGSFVYFNLVVPNFLPLINVLVIMMFTLIISQGASQYIDMEKRTIKIVKTIPVKPFKQLAIKMMIPFTLSFTSLVVSLLVLLISGTISFVTFIFAFILTTVLLFIFNLLAMREELNIRHSKPRSTYMSSVYSYLLPFAYIIVAIVLSFFGLPVFVSYIAGLVIILLLGLPNILYLKKNYYTLFMDLEAVN